ncbi:hypothetical protein UFOVP116_380 [uncultured Caudovirales phage]|uniref:Uncharacterized protein n=1 Tax=uncultured Caudovirales phage TaxID=2100421 RepID=A0A6J5L7D9_9CAUD|nr:hypothetical protein UFOVP116_380 [uncultured Caudovirales phage]
MATNIKDIIQNVKEINMTESSLETVMNFERVIDELGLYAFMNWKKGELVQGPVFEKYFVSCTFMWPYRLMPDPAGGARLLNYDCEVTYKKDTLVLPRIVKSPDDFKAGTKVAKAQKHPIWLVTIVMPRNLIADIRKGSLDLENSTLDIEDLDDAYEKGLSDDANKTIETQSVDNEGQEQ